MGKWSMILLTITLNTRLTDIVLVGGFRALDANCAGVKLRVFLHGRAFCYLV